MDEIDELKRGRRGGVLAVVLTASLVALAGAVFLGVKVVTVAGASMLPGLAAGQRVVASPVPYLLGAPARGDLAVWERPDGTAMLHRVVALAGDRVRIVDGRLTVGGAPLAAEPPEEATCASGRAAGEGAAADPGTCPCLREVEASGDARWTVQRWRPGGGAGCEPGPEAWPPERDPDGRFAGARADNPAWPDYVVPAGHVLLLGDNRDVAFDGRFVGPVPVTRLRGRVVWPR